MITINKLNSLVTYWLLFNDTHNNVSDFSLDYIVEKYDRIYNKKIVNSNELFEFFSNDKYTQNIVFSYCKRWKINFEELARDDNFGVFIFTVYSSTCINKGMPTPQELINKFKLFFGDFKHINNNDNSVLLHEILKRALTNYKTIYPNIYRDIELNMKIDKLKKNKN